MHHEKLLDEKKDKEKHKRRLLEIYLNIIEWGPDIHGLASAADFYFRKNPKDLTLGESIFLATIIPNPKKYERYFDHGVSTKKHQDFMNLIAKLLLEKKVIDKETFDQNVPVKFSIRGQASKLIKGYTVSDSLDIDDFQTK